MRHQRFDARFFIADADDALIDDRAPIDSRELADLRWFTLAEVTELDLPNVTRFVISEIETRLAGAEQADPFYLHRTQGGHVRERISSIAARNRRLLRQSPPKNRRARSPRAGNFAGEIPPLRRPRATRGKIYRGVIQRDDLADEAFIADFVGRYVQRDDRKRLGRALDDRLQRREIDRRRLGSAHGSTRFQRLFQIRCVLFGGEAGHVGIPHAGHAIEAGALA